MKSSALRISKLETTPAPFQVPARRADEIGQRELRKGLIAGLIGGLIGTMVMTEFQNAWSKASEALKSGQTRGQEQGEDATMRAAAKIAGLGGRRLSHEQKKKLGPVVHYTFGTLQGGIYGGVAELAGVPGGFVPGLIFGAALFTVADELAAPALGLSGKPSESPLSSHIYGLAAHLVYGISTEIARRGLRAAL